MDWFATLPDGLKAWLAGASADAAGGVVAELAIRLLDATSARVRRRLQGDPQQQALRRALAEALAAALHGFDLQPDLETHYRALFEAWLQRDAVLEELSTLLDPGEEDLDRNLLAREFTAAGADADWLVDADFDAVIDLLVAGFVTAAAAEEALQEPLKIKLLEEMARRMGAMQRLGEYQVSLGRRAVSHLHRIDLLTAQLTEGQNVGNELLLEIVHLLSESLQQDRSVQQQAIQKAETTLYSVGIKEGVGVAVGDGASVTVRADLGRVEQLLEAIRRHLSALGDRLTTDERSAVRSDHPVPHPPPQVSLEKLPITSPVLFGREAELASLHAAWDDSQTHVLSLVAWGGVGKTALANRWLLDLGQANYQGAQRVFGWSIYSHGASEGRQASADQFIDAALRWFGDPDPAAGSPWDKGERLAALVQRQRTLLVLDGLEPLQYPPGPQEGKLKNPELSVLLRTLARHNPGLLVVTTRLPVADLASFEAATARRIDLEALAPEAGAAYLAHLGVAGSQAEREAASTEFGGHSLALTLLGTLLRDAYDGDVRRRDEVGPLLERSIAQGSHARRAMAAYERWLGPGPETAILRLMGLFDRPAEAAALAVLRAAPPIPGVSEALFEDEEKDGKKGKGEARGLTEREWNLAVARLRRAMLLAAEQPGAPHDLDCHPLVREHFAGQVQAANPKGWQAAHGRLCEHYCGQAEEQPNTLAGLAPLYAAVRHGCLAGRRQEALERIYWRRIQRYNQQHSTLVLGAYGMDLAALAGFFEEPWLRPAAELNEEARAWVLNGVGFLLQALGRLAEAAGPLEAGLEMAIERSDWRNAGISASNLSSLHLATGEVAQAVVEARRAVALADFSHNTYTRMSTHGELANVMHQAGDTAWATALFAAAEALQEDYEPAYPLLYGVRGYLYDDLLLAQGQTDEVLRRATQTLTWAEQHLGPLAIALSHLALGRSYALASDWTQAATHLEQAVDDLRGGGNQEYLSQGLLARAAFHRAQGDLKAARRDLDAALEIVVQSGMRLHEADCYLELARMHLATGESAAAREYAAKAMALVDATGYHRRDGELAEVEAASHEC